MSIFFFAHSIIVPLVILAYFYIERDRFRDDEFLRKVGTFVEGTKKDEKYADYKIAIIIPAAFFIRSLTLSFSVIVL